MAEGPSSAPPPPPDFVRPQDYARAREVLMAAGYTDHAMRDLVGPAADSIASQGGITLALGCAGRGSPLETLIHLFLAGGAVDCEAARRAVHPMHLGSWTEAGLLAERDGRVESRVRLAPFRGLWLAYDLPQHRLHRDFVMGVGTSTVTLLDVAVRRPARAMLDLGSGCGTHALFAARHCERVVAVDSNPQAVGYTRFNARLNGLPNVEAALGDRFEPVSGRRFDLVVSNPPFVISPEPRYTYRDGGLPGDEFSERLIRAAPDFLEEGGFCQVLCNWAHHRGQDWKERLAGWFAGTGCDAWVMPLKTEEPAVYANTWISHTEGEDASRFGDLYRQWTAYYSQRGIERISTGVITMRGRSGGRSWLRINDVPAKILGPCGDEVALCFSLRDFLETVPDDEALMEIRPVVSPVARLQQALRPSEGAWEVEEMELRREKGLQARARVDPYVAGLLARCDGRRTLRELIRDLAATLGQDPASLAGPALQVVRRLIEQAFLLPASALVPHGRDQRGTI